MTEWDLGDVVKAIDDLTESNERIVTYLGNIDTELHALVVAVKDIVAAIPSD